MPRGNIKNIFNRSTFQDSTFPIYLVTSHKQKHLDNKCSSLRRDIEPSGNKLQVCENLQDLLDIELSDKNRS